MALFLQSFFVGLGFTLGVTVAIVLVCLIGVLIDVVGVK